jgi:hypothetical protein
MAPLSAPGGRDGTRDRAGGGVALARRWQHPAPARGRAHRSTGNQRILHDHPAIHHASAIGTRCGSGAGQPDRGDHRRPPAGTIDQEAEDLLHQADDLANALQENPKDKDDSKDEDRGNGKGQDATKKLAELERKVDELIGKDKIRPPATTQIQGAVAELALAVQQEG